MRRIKQRHMTSRGHRPWTAVMLCLLFAFGAILHVSHTTPVQAHASAPEVTAVSGGEHPCEPGHAAAREHCHPTAGCQLCAPVGNAVIFFAPAPARPPIAAASRMPSAVITPHFHPPKPALHA